jgi:hypothetical protein
MPGVQNHLKRNKEQTPLGTNAQGANLNELRCVLSDSYFTAGRIGPGLRTAKGPIVTAVELSGYDLSDVMA